jgi:PadR family transcriptional regulator
MFIIGEHMANPNAISNFELMVMLSLIRLGDEAYGVPISEQIAEQSGHDVALGSVYAALERLEDRGFVVSSIGDPTPERGGRAKKYFKMTGKGIEVVRDTRETLTRMWKGLKTLEGERA